ncbi:hypothetical protein FHW79_005376 [Azospirillum sp. OGB3]|uniref:hypothetical protein n=1 Tax=Azospirillum sp. OGB3 TaxID=2587012 RepID=UPI001605F351|nr:hypothetical protein [Azospirillum sp. OGB3]MBB3267711.1 hypothetical protein [Azospirillum sp. OGB3]
MKEQGYYWVRPRLVGGELGDWDLMWCDGAGLWTEFEGGDPIKESDLPNYFPVIGPRAEPPSI